MNESLFLLLALGFAVSVTLLWRIATRSSVWELIWPRYAGGAIILGGILGLASSFESGETFRFVATGVFLVIASALFVWRLRKDLGKRSG